MTIENTLQTRSGSKCELCASTSALSIYPVTPNAGESAEKHILVCQTCEQQLNNPKKIDINHWRCLKDSMWTPEPAVQVVAWRMLTQLRDEGWPQELLEMLYLEPDVKAWAEATETNDNADDIAPTKDSNGTLLIAGDNVTLIKDLAVKGAGFTAKRGTLVKNIALTDNPKHIEGRVKGTRIVLVSAYLKKV